MADIERCRVRNALKRAAFEEARTSNGGMRFEEDESYDPVEELCDGYLNGYDRDYDIATQIAISRRQSFSVSASSRRSNSSTVRRSGDSRDLEQNDMFAKKGSSGLLVPNARERFKSLLRSKSVRKLEAWKKVLSGWTDPMNQAQRERLLRKGIPKQLRPQVWRMITLSGHMHQKNPGIYEHLCSRESAKSYDSDIYDDLGRTFPNDELFTRKAEGEEWSTGQRDLLQILRAYSAFDKSTGYCQGMNFIAAHLYIVLGDAESAFWALVQVMKDIKGLFTEGLSMYNMCLDIFENLCHKHLPNIAGHFERERAMTVMIAGPWVNTFFTGSNFPNESVHRIWDLYLYFGPEIIFRVGLALLKLSEGSPLAILAYL
eukprot:TRINITY_DN2699_c0_g1_i3.p1 TRINITY_DN2699_c0_g1~~TRINITY_DN2699_c0_g1_i3.p1  ORF type:complete len:373 (+),score=69.99 TRINITY_DN2699_c0_g1_i3:199-1317(+)